MDNPPKSICILRLSAIGDVTHMVPVVRTIQKYWPKTQLTWIIGKKEANLVYDIPNIEFIQFDKSNVFSSYKNIVQKMKHRKFEQYFSSGFKDSPLEFVNFDNIGKRK